MTFPASDPPGAKQTKSSPLRHAFNVAFPIAVIGLFLWWFGTIPPYSEPSLPSNWTPQCPQWEAEWNTRRVKSTAGDAAGLAIFGVLPNAQHLVVGSANARSIAGSTELLDATSGALLRETSQPLLWYPYSATEGLLISDPYLYTRSMNVITGHDPLTFELLGERTLQAPADVGDGAIMTVTAGSLRAGPDGSIYGVGVINHDPQNQYVSYWFHADRDGGLLQERRLGKLTSTPSDSALSTPGRYCFMDQELTLNCIDLATGQPVSLPPLPSRAGESVRGWESTTLGEIPRGWQEVSLTVWPDEGPRITPLLIEPIILSPPRPKHDDSGEREDRSAFQRARYFLWSKLYGEAAIDQRRRDARRFAALDLRVDALGIDHRLLTGDVARSLSYQAVRSSTPLTVTQETGRFRFSFGPTESLWMPLQVYPLDDSQVLVAQFVESPPDVNPPIPALLRIGLLIPDASAVQWLGWVPLSSEQASWQTDSIKPSFYRAGDQLVIWFPGYVIYRVQGSSKPSHSRPLSWTIIPLPPALADLPEGPL